MRRRRRRSLGAELLAVVALAAAGVGVVLVVTETSGDSKSSTATTATTSAGRKIAGRFMQRRYRVRRGDTLGLISQKSGVEIADLQKLNPGIDANSLNAGQVITLRRRRR